MKKSNKFFYGLLALNFFQVIHASDDDFNQGEILSENIMYYNAGTQGVFTDETAPYAYRLIHNPKKVEEIKQSITDIEKISLPDGAKDYNELLQSGVLKSYYHFGMGQYKFTNSTNEYSYLHTDGIKDCIGIVGYASKTGKSFLYHASKMELRKNYEDKYSFETHFVKEFNDNFIEDKPKITLVGSCYSDDLTTLLNLLKDNHIKVSAIDFPDILYMESRAIDPMTALIRYSNSIAETL